MREYLFNPLKLCEVCLMTCLWSIYPNILCAVEQLKSICIIQLLGVHLCVSVYACVCAKSLQSCPTLCDPWAVAHQAPLSMGFSRQNVRVGCHTLLQSIFPVQGSNLRLCIYCIGRCVLHHQQHWGRRVCVCVCVYERERRVMKQVPT